MTLAAGGGCRSLILAISQFEPAGSGWHTETGSPVSYEVQLVDGGISMDIAELTVGDLFDRLPVQFGLRGDPYLWQVLRTEFAETPMPSSWFGLRGIVYEAVERVIGRPLKEHADSASVYVSEFDPGHGMSSGHVDMAWWVNTGVPILFDRFEALRPAD